MNFEKFILYPFVVETVSTVLSKQSHLNFRFKHQRVKICILDLSKMKSIFFLFVIIFVKIDARNFKGQCRKRPAPVVEPFCFERYMGKWYEVRNRKN